MAYSILRREHNAAWAELNRLTRDDAIAIYCGKIGIIPVHLHADGVCVNPWDSDVMQCQFATVPPKARW